MTEKTKMKHVLHEYLHGELRLPEPGEELVKITQCGGNNLHEVETENGENFLVSMPRKWRKTIWIKQGDYVLIERIPENDRVKGEIVLILSKDHIRYYKEHKLLPPDPEKTFDIDSVFSNRRPNFYESSSSDSESD